LHRGNHGFAVVMGDQFRCTAWRGSHSERIVTERVVRYLFANKEMIGGVAVQGKEIYDVVSEHGPIFWRKIKHCFMKKKGGKVYIVCTSDSFDDCGLYRSIFYDFRTIRK
jgi:hypothetical protein